MFDILNSVVIIKKKPPIIGYALFAGGLSSVNGNLGTSRKYTYSTLAASAGPNLQVSRSWMASIGNKEKGFLVGGEGAMQQVSTALEELDFSLDTFAAGRSLGVAREGSTGASNNEYGYILGGSMNGGNTSVITKVTFATQVSESAGATANIFGSCPTAVGDDLHFHLLGDGYLVEKFIYATGAKTSSYSLKDTRSYPASGSTKTYGTIFGGYGQGYTPTNACETLTYATGATTRINSLSTPRWRHTATGDDTMAIVCAGYTTNNSNLSSTEVHTYATKTFKSGTSLQESRNVLSALTSTPGHL